MACYYGCDTGSNRCAWFWYVVLVALGVALLGLWGVRTGTCLNDAGACADQYGLTSMVSLDQTAGGTGGQITNVGQLCTDLYGTAAVPPGSVPDSATLVAHCEVCTNQFVACAQPTLPLMIGGVFFMVASILPCFFCCLCASPPASSKYY